MQKYPLLSFPGVKEIQSMTHEETAEGKWAIECLRGDIRYSAIFPVCQDIERVPQTWNIPGIFLEFCPEQRRRTLATIDSRSSL